MKDEIREPPKGLMILTLVGPGLVWAAEYIGSGETTMGPRIGALFGVAYLWLIILTLILKYFVGLGAGYYTTITGEGAIDMFSRVPGPKNWLVWLVFIVQFCAAIASPSALAALAGTYGKGLIDVSPIVWAWGLTLFSALLGWIGRYEIIEKVMSVLVLLMVICVLAGSVMVAPPFREYFALSFPEVPEWAIGAGDVSSNALMELLPLLGWAGGGFASMVWYSYWVQGKRYGLAQGEEFLNPRPARVEILQNLNVNDAKRLKGWTKVVTADATASLLMGSICITAFVTIAAGTLYHNKIVPTGSDIGITISMMLDSIYGSWARYFYLVGTICALTSTQIAHFSGWPRMLSDCLRVGIKRKKIDMKKSYRSFIILMFFIDLIVIYTFGVQPYLLAKIASIWDGLIFFPLLCIVLIYALHSIIPKLISDESKKVLKPNRCLEAGLIAATIVFSIYVTLMLPGSI